MTHRLSAIRERLAKFLPGTKFCVRMDQPYATTQSWAAANRRAPGARYEEIHAAEIVTLRSPLHDFGCNGFTVGRLQERYPASFIAAIPGGRVWARPFAFNLVVASDGRPLEDLVFRTFEYRAMAERLGEDAKRPPKARSFPGTTLDLTCPGDGKNYYHWMVDCLPKLDWLDRLTPAVRVDRILVNAKTPFALETLRAAGWDSDRIVALDETAGHVACELLLATSPITSSYPPRRVLETLRRRFVTPPAWPGSRLFLSRADASTRRVENEAAVIALLRRLGFSPAILVELTVQQQAALFSSARCVVAPHGAGLTNLLFCPPGTRVMEWFPSGYSDLTYWSLSSTLDLEYACMTFPSRGADPKHADFEVHLGRLESALHQMGLSS